MGLKKKNVLDIYFNQAKNILIQKINRRLIYNNESKH